MVNFRKLSEITYVMIFFCFLTAHLKNTLQPNRLVYYIIETKLGQKV
jgi:hypothetical protein